MTVCPQCFAGMTSWPLKHSQKMETCEPCQKKLAAALAAPFSEEELTADTREHLEEARS